MTPSTSASLSQTKINNYTLGHDKSVLASHGRRTAKDILGFLLPHVKQSDHILDVGCGPGSITRGFAEYASQGSVIGLDYGQDAIDAAEKSRLELGLKNISFQQGDCSALPFADNTFDVVYCHAVLCHVKDPIGALKEMRRVCKVGGLVAAREPDFGTMAMHAPKIPLLHDAMMILGKLCKHGGGEPYAGRYLVGWTMEAGFARHDVQMTVGTTVDATVAERAALGPEFAKRIVGENGDRAVQSGLCTEEERQGYVDAWLAFAEPECLDGAVTRPCNQVIGRKSS